MTPAAAQTIHRSYVEAGRWIMWLIGQNEASYPGKMVAWAVVADRHGGTRQDGELVADTLDELRAMLPRDLRRGEPLAFWWPGVVEIWD